MYISGQAYAGSEDEGRGERGEGGGGSKRRVHLLMTPRMREQISSMSSGCEGCFDLISTAEVSRRVAMGFKPAAFIVSPDSGSR